jgi:homocitrate synthase NifV
MTRLEPGGEMRMRPRRRIVDTTLKDGEQSPDHCFSRWQKLMIARLLDESGVSQIEVGAPASCAYEKETIRMIAERRNRAKISVWSRLSASGIRHCVDIAPDIIHLSVPASYVQIYAKLRKNKSWVLNQLEECLDLLQGCPAEISVGLEDAFRSDVSFLAAIARAAIRRGVRRIKLADTVGLATPRMCREMFTEMSQKLDNQAELGYHAHNDLGMAVASSIEALKSRCLHVDTTIMGIGERAGNCDYAKLVKAAWGLFDFGATPQSAQSAQEGFLRILGEDSGPS